MEIAPINFCNKFAFNVRNENHKTSILREIFDNYQIIATENSCTVYDRKYARLLTSQSNYLLSTNTNGNRYYLYFRRDEFDKNMCVFIDRKICRGYKYPRIIYTNFRLNNNIFDGTLFHGELIRTSNDKWLFLLNDVVAYCGQLVSSQKRIQRIQIMYDFLNNNYISDNILDVCEFQVKQFFHYGDLNYMTSKFINNLPYKVNGIVFNSLFSGKTDLLLLHNFNTAFVPPKKIQIKSYSKPYSINSPITSTSPSPKSMNSVNSIKPIKPVKPIKSVNSIKPIKSVTSISTNIKKPKKLQKQNRKDIEQPNNENMFTFIINKTVDSIFQLISYVNKNQKIFGYARIDKLKTQKLVDKLLAEHTLLLMDCKYNTKFRRFVPVKHSEKSEPDQYIDVEYYVENL